MEIGFTRDAIVVRSRLMVGAVGPAVPGDVIAGRYRIEGWLGQGNMAAVFRATHLATDRAVALKLVHAHLIERREICELFIREARVGARIGKNAHIVDVLDAGIDERRGVPFLAMELLEGDTLDRYVKKNGPMPPSLVRTLFMHLADALDQAHAAGVVHRDLKPGNLFLTRERKNAPSLKVVDFGIAKILEQDAGRTATQIGSPAYAAPEQLGPELRELAATRGITIAHGVSPATDIWPLGLIAYELLVGAPPAQFWSAQPAITLVELMMTVALGSTPMASVRAGASAHLLPRDFDAWIARCLHKNAAERWPTVIDAVEHLLTLLDEGYEEPQTLRRRSDRPVQLRSRSSRPPGPASSERTVPLPDAVQPPDVPIPLVRPAMSSSPEQPVPAVEAATSSEDEGVIGARTQPFSLMKSPSDTLPQPTVPVPAGTKPTAPVQIPIPACPEPVVPPIANLQGITLRSSRHEIIGDEPMPEIAPNSAMLEDVAPGAGTDQGIGGTKPPPEVSEPRPWGRLAGVAAFLAMTAGAAFALLPKAGKLTVVVKGTGDAPVAAAEVFVDDQKRCDVVPCVLSDLKPGKRSIKVIAAGAPPVGPLQETVERGQDKTLTIRASTQPPVKLSGKPIGAKVFVDGELKGTLPVALEGLAPGSHKLRIEGGERYQALERTIDIVAGQATDLGTVNLAVLQGLVTIERVTPGATVMLVDSRKVEKRITEEQWRSPPVKIELEPAQGWRLIARRTGYSELVQPLPFDDGVAERTVRVELVQQNGSPR